ncbi:sulfatase-like hydrolase/transferase [Lutimonas saemankumensis]|uniref:sulfatase-like hydrolase/transferase n=1 Tax=Lutimonas saemankumensis TaxID=483016 RepID=UPI001CD2685A|nr:sulfatase-like hydrolase/transferase [Lutimonas saemankumensis]MCA0931958.1 sulfatase-like hydrolase/transferase [Lutimonas saemankumensis]
MKVILRDLFVNKELNIARILYSLPILVSPALIFIIYGKYLYPDVLGFNILIILLTVLGATLIFNHSVGAIMEITSLILLNLMVFIDFSHIYLFEYNFSQSSMYVLLETNKSEASSFLSMYFDKNLFLFGSFILLCISVSSYLIRKYFRINKSDYLIIEGGSRAIKQLFIFFSATLVFAVFLYYNKYNFLPYTIVKGYNHYHQDWLSFQKLGNNKVGGNFSNVKLKSNQSNQNVVLVLGESTTNGHMGIYGYYRNTTPRLNELKNELLIFQNVISPHASTIPSLSKILTLGDYNNPERKFDGSIIQLFNKAGFKTYWISAQDKTGVNSSFVTGISNACDDQIFISSYDYTPLDGEILNPLKEVLSNDTENKLIILHLLGTHTRYDERYPEDFDKFKSTPRTKFKHEDAYKYINEYDNAILYNDYVISEIISLLKESKTRSSFLYLSDHGEEVYQSLNIAGHWEEKFRSTMYEIPFIIWSSDYTTQHFKTFEIDVDRKYNSEDLIYTMADLANVSFIEFDSTKSLINKNFEYKNRMILKNLNFDQLSSE